MTGQNANLFTRLDQGVYLHNRPEADVFKLPVGLCTFAKLTTTTLI
jgi:hypothetical protein